MLKNIFGLKPLTKLKPFKFNQSYLLNFSTFSPSQQAILQDWQYVQKISQQIKDSDINQALKYFIQSNLNKQILNKQIYYTFYEKLTQLSSPLSYHEILYKLYRQNFLPNPMTLNWMKKISMNTQNTKILQQLKNDYQLINEPWPLNESKQPIKQQKNDSKQNNNDNQEKNHGRKSRKVPTISTTDQYYAKTPGQILVSKKNQSIDQKQQHDKLKIKKIDSHIYKVQKLQTHSNNNHTNPNKYSSIQPNSKTALQLQTSTQIQSLLQNMFKQYGKVTLHDIQLTMDYGQQQMNEQQMQMYQDNQNQHYQDGQNNQQSIEEQILHMISCISKIKIGKIEFTSPHGINNLEQEIKDNSNGNFNDKAKSSKNNDNDNNDKQ